MKTMESTKMVGFCALILNIPDIKQFIISAATLSNIADEEQDFKL
jgi:hypothetical protein